MASTEEQTLTEAGDAAEQRRLAAERSIIHEDARPTTRELIDAAAAGKLAGEQHEEQQDALEWLLEAFDAPDSAKETLHAMSVNVGGLGPNAKWVRWTVRNVDGTVLRKLREESMGRRGGTLDLNAVFRANIAVVVEGTVHPPLREAAKARSVADPGILVEEAFKTKPGLIEAIAGTIMDLSGYDPDAARDEREVSAAGNS